MPRAPRSRWLLRLAIALAIAVVVLAFATRRKTRLRLAYPPGEVVTTKDVTFVEGSKNPRQTLDVYAPAGRKDAPVVVFVHGGSWIHEDKDEWSFVTGLYGSIGVSLAKRGIVTVIPNYRLGPEVDIDGILDDVAAALRWTTAHAREHGGDARRIVLMGHSAGAHLVALAAIDERQLAKRGVDPRIVAGVVALSTVWSIEEMHDDLGAALGEKVTYPVFGRDRARWDDYSPLSRMHVGQPPLLVAVGGADYAYMIPAAARATERAKALGNEAEHVLVPGYSHREMVLTFGARDDALSDRVAAFAARVTAAR
ncbi:MAG: alpha/beta hydrolase [Deltaproteobacteria bacterium]|nr:alpha/beta hydrolase [Deltaproteobacteria bacterium]